MFLPDFDNSRVFRPEMFGAVGDGREESARVQAAVDEAEATPGSSVLLNPRVSYGVENTVDIGGGTYPITFKGVFSGFADSRVTFQKLADIPAWRVLPSLTVFPCVTNIMVRGRGAVDPTLTDTGLDSTPAALIHSRCTADCLGAYLTGGTTAAMASPLGEAETDGGYCFGFIQLATLDNINTIRAPNGGPAGIWLESTTGGVYMANPSGSNVNVNAAHIIVPRAHKVKGSVVNNIDGFRNRFTVGTANGLGGTSVFRMSYIENVCELQYAEDNSYPYLVEFPDSNSTKNIVSAHRVSEDKFSSGVINGAIRNNTVAIYGKTYVGDGAADTGLWISGASGLKLDRAYLPTPADAAVFSAITEAHTADIGANFDLLAGATAGYVTWTSRVAKLAKVGKICSIALHLSGTLGTASTANANLKLDIATTGITIENLSNLGIIGPFRLVNSVGTSVVYMSITSTSQFTIVDPVTLAIKNFNAVVGAGAFTISGMIQFNDTGGQV